MQMERKIDSEEVRRLYENGWTVRRISRHLGFTYAGIRQRLVRDGVKIREGVDSKFDVALLRELYVEKKMSASDARRAIGASHATFYRLVREAGIPLRSKPMVDPVEIRRLYTDLGWTLQQIARHLGVYDRRIKLQLLKDGVPLRGRHNYRHDPAKTRKLVEARKMSIAEAAEELGASRSTVWRQLKLSHHPVTPTTPSLETS